MDTLTRVFDLINNFEGFINLKGAEDTYIASVDPIFEE